MEIDPPVDFPTNSKRTTHSADGKLPLVFTSYRNVVLYEKEVKLFHVRDISLKVIRVRSKPLSLGDLKYQ